MGNFFTIKNTLEYFTGTEISKELFLAVGDWSNGEKLLKQRAKLYLLTKKLFLHKANK